ncbi:peptidylprolyl isomerase [Reyranella sp.]|jgi:peptidyl-prolyl cis-trans isomerase C|uniref:peptidylprolyl isomerase n=1 Tax=Reyranella sp. TaxID=1929291 RepID=UPI003C7C0C38
MSTSQSTTATPPVRRRFTRPVPVSVNGVVIPSAAIAREAQHHQAADPDQAWMLAAQALAVRELLSQEAERLSIVAEPVEDGEGRRETLQEARLRELVEREVKVPSADDAACRRYYQANLGRFRSADLCEVAHILIANGPQAQELAGRLIAELRRQPERLAEIAAAHSVCPSRNQGGNLGQIGPGQTVPEFEAALSGLEVGKIHPEPIETRYGLHIVRLDRRIEGRQMPFEVVRDRIADYLEDTVHRRALRQYVTILAGRAQLTGVDFGAAAGPLVQ